MKNNMKTTATTSSLMAVRDMKDFTMTPDMVDVRAWDVVGPDGTVVGKVDRIMMDTHAKHPRYLLVKLLDRGEYMLLPIGIGRLNQTKKLLLLNMLSMDTFKAIPLLSTDVVTVEMEWKVLGAVGSRKAYTTVNEWYADPLFDATRIMGSTRHTLTS